MNDEVRRIARAAAERLAAGVDDSTIVDDVEAELYARDNGRRPQDYLDPIALGGLVVSVANLAWVIYVDRGKVNKAKPTQPELEKAVTAELPEDDAPGSADRSQVITIVVEETIRADEDAGPGAPPAASG